MTTKITPLNKNIAELYVRRYLGTVSDWNTYLVPGAPSFGAQADAVTNNFFGSKILQGAVILFGAHLSQQITAGAAGIVVRGWFRGEELATHAGVSVRKLRLKKAKTGGPEWKEDLGLLMAYSGMNEKLARLGASLSRRVQLQDLYTFNEGGRAWVNYTLRFPTHEGPRTLTALTMLAFPNRNYYFDRVLPFHRAVEIAQGRTGPETVPGFVGDTVELDQILPVVRLLKLTLYGLNWYLVEPAERDSAPVIIDVAGYNTLVPPVTPPIGSTANPYTTLRSPRPLTAARRPWSTAGIRDPYQPPAYDWRGNPLPPTPGGDYFGAPAAPAVQTSFLPPTMEPRTVNVALELLNKDNVRETAWVAVEAWDVLDTFGRPTGLVVAPAIVVDQAGNFIASDSWGIIHVETGRSLNSGSLRTAQDAQRLGGQLAAIADWRKPFDQITAAEKTKAQAVINDFR